MPNQNSKTIYDASDLMDAHDLAHTQLSWVNALVATVKNGNQEHSKELLEIAQYLCEMSANSHDFKRATYEQEWNAQRGDQ